MEADFVVHFPGKRNTLLPYTSPHTSGAFFWGASPELVSESTFIRQKENGKNTNGDKPLVLYIRLPAGNSAQERETLIAAVSPQ